MTHTQQTAPLIDDFTAYGNIRKQREKKINTVSRNYPGTKWCTCNLNLPFLLEHLHVIAYEKIDGEWVRVDPQELIDKRNRAQEDKEKKEKEKKEPETNKLKDKELKYEN